MGEAWADLRFSFIDGVDAASIEEAGGDYIFMLQLADPAQMCSCEEEFKCLVCEAREVLAIILTVCKRYPLSCPMAIAVAVSQGDQDIDPLDEPLAPCPDCTCDWEAP